jgi:L-rhamnose mutarotase
MTVFTFDKLLFVISGPLHVRIHNVLNAMLVAKAYNADFKLIWLKEPDFEYELDDIFQTICFENNVASSLDIVKDTNYYYNPYVTIDKFLSSCVANGLEHQFNDKEFTNLEWIVFDNFNGKKIRMIPEGILNETSYRSHLDEIRDSLLYSIHVDGYINLFQSIQNEQDMICVYVSKNDNISDYYEYLDTIDKQLFIVFHWDYTQEERTMLENKIKDKYKNKCLFVVHETHSRIIEYMCLKHCRIIVTLTHFDDYVNSSITDKSILYTILDKTASNIKITSLQKLM